MEKKKKTERDRKRHTNKLTDTQRFGERGRERRNVFGGRAECRQRDEHEINNGQTGRHTQRPREANGRKTARETGRDSE